MSLYFFNLLLSWNPIWPKFVPLYVVFVVCKAYFRESFSGGRTDVQTAEANVSSIEDEDDRACCGGDGEWEEMALLLAAFERSKFRYIPECSVEMHKQQPYVGMDVVRRGDPGGTSPQTQGPFRANRYISNTTRLIRKQGKKVCTNNCLPKLSML